MSKPFNRAGRGFLAIAAIAFTAWSMFAQDPSPKAAPEGKDLEKAPQPRESGKEAAKVDFANKLVDFEFTDARWDEVVRWFTKESGLGFAGDKPPVATFSFKPGRDADGKVKQYTIKEVIDILNDALLTKGFLLQRRQGSFTIIPADERPNPPDVPLVNPGELNNYGDREFVKVVIGPVKSVAAEDVVVKIKPLMENYSWVVPMPQSNRIVFVDQAARLKTFLWLINQLPGEDGGKKGGFEKRGPPRFELGKVLPPFVREAVDLTPAQEKQIADLEKEVRERLQKILTAEQQKRIETAEPKGPPEGKDGRGRRKEGPPEGKGQDNPGGDDRDRPERLDRPPLASDKKEKSELRGPQLILPNAITPVATADGSTYQLTGDATEGVLGDPRTERVGRGVRFLSGNDLDKDGAHAGTAAWTVTGLKPESGRWFRIRIRGLAQDGFAVDKDDLFLQVEYFKDKGKNPLDHVKKSIFGQVELDRKNLADAGTNRNLGKATWRNYSINVRTPFPEVDTLRVSAGFGNGTGKTKQSEFWISEVEVAAIPDPADYNPPQKPSTSKNPPALSALVRLGGRWYYDPRGGSKEPPKQFDSTNVDRLYYLTDRLETPFVNNTSAWLRKGYLDRNGKLVENDQFVTDSVVISFTDRYLVMKSKNLPNHPTAVFPDRSRFLDGNPNFIQEQRDTWRIPLEPKENPRHVAMTADNKRVLPMGPIGVAVNGCVFFNPFDMGQEEAIDRLDRCCGHPSPTYEYHYHKYPACVNTPWDDDGAGHSPLIGFAFDGFPVYGPYEAAGQMAKDSKTNPLNLFNLHNDEARGPHYHVTPGKFPHIIGGYWGEVDASNRGGKKGPPKK
jgi:YHYH protein